MSESSATASPTPSRPPSSSDSMTRRQLFATASGQLRIGPAYVPVEATPGALNVGHGHVIPRPDGVRARCGGPGLCRECSQDMARQRTEGTVDVHVSGSVARVTIAADVRKLAEALRAAAEEAARVWPPRRPDAEAVASTPPPSTVWGVRYAKPAGHIVWHDSETDARAAAAGLCGSELVRITGRVHPAGDTASPEPPRPTACEACGTSYDACTDRIMRGSRACCRACYSTDRHAAIPWEQWRRRQRTRDAEAARPTPPEGVAP